jgi:hypothetical protein
VLALPTQVAEVAAVVQVVQTKMAVLAAQA